MKKMQYFRLLALLAVFLLGTLQAVSMIPKKDKVNLPYSTPPSASTGDLYVRNEFATLCGDPQPDANIHKATLHVLLNWKSDDLAAGNTAVYTATVTINGYSDFGTSTLVNTYTELLSVNTNNPQSYVDVDFTGLHSQINHFKITVNYSSSVNPTIESMLETYVSYTEEFDYTVNSLVPLQWADQVIFNGNEATFKWGIYCSTPAPNYQFQLLRLFNNNIATSSSETTITTDINWDRALTIETGNSLTELSLTLAEGTGYYIWRVRPVGNAYEGGAGNDMNWGLWSTTGSYTSGGYVISANEAPHLFFYNQFDDNMNWIFSRSFVEGDAQTHGQVVIGESMNYANGLQMALQHQSRLRTEKKKLVGETIYDYSGRAALTTMVAAVEESSLGYISAYIKNATGNVYSAADFDDNANYLNPPAIDMTNPGPGKYYSNNNDLESDVPTADGYAYSRTLYMNDGTSSPKEQSGPGDKHRLGYTGTNKHTTRNYISSVADAELITVFGDEAPDAAGVLKSITVDANNGSSISYVSKEGQTIATCLSNPGAPNLDALPTVAVPLAVDYYLGNNVPYGSGGLISFKNIVLTQSTAVTISYSLTPNAYEDECVEFCATCDYKVSINVIDNDNPSGPPPVTPFTATVNPTSGTGDCSAGPTNYTVSVTLPAGSYTIQRTIEAYQVNSSSTPPAGTVPYTPFLDQYLKQVENGMLSDFNNSPAVIVDDLGVPVPGAPSVTMDHVLSFLPAATASDPNPIPDIDGLYAYLGIAPTSTQDHINLQIGCHTITLPIHRCPSNECPQDHDFEKYFTDWYNGHYGSTATINTMMSQYTAGEFNTVVANMINCGGYDCEALYTCWRTIVSSYATIHNMTGTALSGSYNGYSMPPGMTYTPDFLDMFLDCAGYKLAGVNNSVGGSGCTGANLGYKFHPYAYFSYSTSNRCTNCEGLFYLQPATTPPNPLTAPTHTTGTSPYTWASAADFVLDLNASGANYEQMKTFFDCIQICNTTGATTTPAAFAAGVIASAQAICEDRYEGFVEQLIEEYHQNNVHVEGDEYQLQYYAPYNYYVFNSTPYTYNPATDISMATIYCQAQGLVAACKQQCTLTVTTTGQTSVGTPAEIAAMSNALYGTYDLQIPPPTGICPNGYSSTNWNIPFTDFLPYVIHVMNEKLDEVRATAPANGFYWNFKSFLTANLGSFSCSGGDYIFVHPLIPSYFDFENAVTGGGCKSLVYYFNRQHSTSTLSTKRLYSASLISAAVPYISDGFNYVGTIPSTGAAAMNEQLLTSQYSYLISSSFSPRAATALSTWSMTDLTTAYGAGTINNATSLYGYKLTANLDNGFYKSTLCSSICQGAASCSTICYKINPAPVMAVNSPEFEAQGVLLQPVSCEQELASEIMNSFNQQVGEAISNEKVKIKNSYHQKCIDELVDETKISLELNYHHYTLYYYDRAGNLVKTVPPNGVELVSPQTSRAMHPDYPFRTEYAYNSLHELVRQKTPDGGETNFWYDKTARLRFSQNEKQFNATPATMSYTKYDALGRVKEAGEMPASSTPNTDVDNQLYPASGMTDIVVTNYSDPASVAYFGGKPQRYLQNRVSWGYSDKDGNPATPGDQVATYYSYDPHGNVEWLIQDIPEIGKNYVAYEYDLISGSVVKVKYNEAFADRFFHRYTYDADKRLKTVETSKDEIFWELDGNYKYYLHGPLKRAEIGHEKVQGLDYTYTIMGWLKGLNHVNSTYDPGKDGNETGNTFFAKDIYGMHLGYYEHDYISKNSRANSETANPYYLPASSSTRDLYNGNISSWSSNYDYSSLSGTVLAGMQHTTTINGRVFNYDELNRITSSNFKSYDPAGGVWSTSNDYKEQFSYSSNGNIKYVTRNGYAANAGGLLMDDFTYNYVGGKNWLDNVNDFASATAYTTDIDAQNPAGNYRYDLIGNLTYDFAGGVSNIAWTPQGKVSKVTKSDGTLIEFLYDMMGQRVYKKVYKPADAITLHKTYYYVVDAGGNSIAIYNRSNTGSGTSYVAHFDLTDQPIYGSDRIGERSLHGDITRDVPFTTSPVSGPVPQGLPTPVHISAWPTISVPLSNTAATQIYNRPMNLSSGTNGISDLGNNTNAVVISGATISHGRCQAMAFDNAGLPLLMAYTHSQSGTLTNFTRIYKYPNGLISASSSINASAGNQSLFIKRPGSDDEYFYVTIDGNTPYYHIIDVSSGTLVDFNNPIVGAGNCGPAMAVIDDRSGAPVLYLSSYGSGTTTINSFIVTHDGFVLSSATPVTFTSANAGDVGELQISASGTLMAVTNNVSGSSGNGEVRMYRISADHQSLSDFGKQALASSSLAKSVEFTQNDSYIYFTSQKAGTTTMVLYRQLVSLFGPGATPALPGSANSTTSASYSLRRGSCGNLYFVTFKAGTTNSVINMITAPENSTLSSPWGIVTNSIATTVSNGSLPTKAHVIDYQLLTASPVVYQRILDKKVYEIKDHLGNVHATVSDYKTPVTDANLIFARTFVSLTTEGFSVLGGSPAGTIVENVNNQLRIFGTQGSAATINLTSVTLPAGNQYVMSFDYIQQNAAMASYTIGNGGNVQVKGFLSNTGRQAVAFNVPAGAAYPISLTFTCEDPLANRTFYIDNIIIKKVTSTLTDAINIVNDNFSSGGNWNGSLATITYPSGVLNAVANGTGTLSVNKDLALIAGRLYKVDFDLNVTTIGGTSSLNLEYTDNGSPKPNYSYFVRNSTGSGSYTYYFVPTVAGGNLAFSVTNAVSGSPVFTLDNVVVTQYENNSQPLYTANLRSLTDYYAFGAPMPGRNYSGVNYRYGFNGKEQDDETYGDGNEYDYGFRIYDPRLGRFLSVDPLFKAYPWYTPYQFSGNKPIWAVDLDGREEETKSGVNAYFLFYSGLRFGNRSIIPFWGVGVQVSNSFGSGDLGYVAGVKVSNEGNIKNTTVGAYAGFFGWPNIDGGQIDFTISPNQKNNGVKFNPANRINFDPVTGELGEIEKARLLETFQERLEKIRDAAGTNGDEGGGQEEVENPLAKKEKVDPVQDEFLGTPNKRQLKVINNVKNAEKDVPYQSNYDILLYQRQLEESKIRGRRIAKQISMTQSTTQE
jgi:RHS repeat-associated protein